MTEMDASVSGSSVKKQALTVSSSGVEDSHRVVILRKAVVDVFRIDCMQRVVIFVQRVAINFYA